MDLKEQILKSQKGDKKAFADVVGSFNRLVIALAANYLGAMDAEDAAQQIWLAVWKKLWQLEEPDKFGSWLRQVIFHQCLNIRKARATRRDRETLLSNQAWAGLAQSFTNDCSVEEILELKELRILLSRELDQLPGDYGLLLRLYYLRDMSYQEISATTGIPNSTLKWRMHQGRKLLKPILARHLTQRNKRRFLDD